VATTTSASSSTAASSIAAVEIIKRSSGTGSALLVPIDRFAEDRADAPFFNYWSSGVVAPVE
jgi:hypothetical protein